MYLVGEQAQRYQISIASLLDYADKSLGVTQALPPQDADRLLVDRLLLVARELWRSTDVIGRYVYENPDGLPDSYISTVRVWQDALYCRCAFVGLDSAGNALVETEAGTFSVQGVANDVSLVLPGSPSMFKGALIPFDGVIVLGFPLDSCAKASAGEIAWMRERAAERGFHDLVSTAEGLVQRSKEYARIRAEHELTQLARGAHENSSSLPTGFHRGSLASLPPADRQALSMTHLSELLDGVVSNTWLERHTGVMRHADASTIPIDDQGQEATSAVASCALLYGAISMTDAYDQYVAASADPLTRRRFERVVGQAARMPGALYGIWEDGGVRYVIAFELDERNVFGDGMDATEASGCLGAYDVFAESGGRASDEYASIVREQDVEIDLAMLHDCCRGLLFCKFEHGRRPVGRRMVERGPLACFLGMDATLMLRDFVDAHIPDGQDDEYFADSLVAFLAIDLVMLCAEVDDVYDHLTSLGMMRCEGGDWSDTLGKMVVNLRNSLPSWQQGGWSARQLKERLTGKREFYASDGSVMRVGRDDPCPCGSALKYRDCCGR